MEIKLQNMLDDVMWKHFRVDDLFDVQTSTSINEGELELSSIKTNTHNIEFVGRTDKNNGIKGFVSELNDIKPNSSGVFAISQIGTLVTTIRTNKWYASQNIFILTPRDENLFNLFVLTSLNKMINAKYENGYNNYPTLNKLKNNYIQLPVNELDEIDYDFMEYFMAKVQTINNDRLEKYLKDLGFDSYSLTKEEQALLKDLKNDSIKYGHFRIGDLFEIGTGSLINNKDLIEGTIPRISVKSDDNGIVGYYDTEDLEKARHFENFISVNFFGQCFYHPYKASVEMKVHVLKLPNKEYTKEIALFITTALNKALNGQFDYAMQLSSSKLKKNDYYIQLPVDELGEIDYDLMEKIMRLMQKISMKDIVMYHRQNIASTEEIINAYESKLEIA